MGEYVAGGGEYYTCDPNVNAEACLPLLASGMEEEEEMKKKKGEEKEGSRSEQKRTWAREDVSKNEVAVAKKQKANGDAEEQEEDGGEGEQEEDGKAKEVAVGEKTRNESGEELGSEEGKAGKGPKVLGIIDAETSQKDFFSPTAAVRLVAFTLVAQQLLRAYGEVVEKS